MKKWWCKTTTAKSKQYLRWEAFFFRKITTLNSSGIFARNTRKDYSKGNKTVSLWIHTSPAASSWHQKMSMCSCAWKHTHKTGQCDAYPYKPTTLKKKKKKGPTAISQILLHNSNAVGITTLFLIVVCLFVLSSRQISIIVTHIYNNNKQIQGNVFLHSQVGNVQTGNNLQ